MSKTIDQMKNHLEFLGYEIEVDGERIKARHSKKFNMVLKPYAGGVLLTAIFGCTDTAKKKKLDYLELLNSFNENASISRFYADKDADLFIEAWYPDHYDRSAFGAFLEKWDRDSALMVANSKTTDFLR